MSGVDQEMSGKRVLPYWPSRGIDGLMQVVERSWDEVNKPGLPPRFYWDSEQTWFASEVVESNC